MKNLSQLFGKLTKDLLPKMPHSHSMVAGGLEEMS